jgi:hypothetical protein
MPPSDRILRVIALGKEVFEREPSGPPWVVFFEKIAQSLTGLKSLEVVWDCAYDCAQFGGGTDVTLPRARKDQGARGVEDGWMLCERVGGISC